MNRPAWHADYFIREAEKENLRLLTQPIDPTGDPIDGDDEIEYIHWQYAQDDALADSFDPVIVGTCYDCGQPITSDQYEQSTTHHQPHNGCDVDLDHYRCTCGAAYVD